MPTRRHLHLRHPRWPSAVPARRTARYLRRAVTAGLVTVGLVLGLDYATYAATGKPLILGRSNSAGTVTTLTRTTSGAVLSLRPRRSTNPPLAVAGTGKVANLNVDRLDSLDSTAFQRRIARSCAAGSVIQGIDAAGRISCQALPVAEIFETFAYSRPPANPVEWFVESASFPVGMLPAGTWQVSLSASPNPRTPASPSAPITVECSLRTVTADPTQSPELGRAMAIDVGKPQDPGLSTTRLVALDAATALTVRCVPNGTVEWNWGSRPLTVEAVRVQPAAAFPAAG